MGGSSTASVLAVRGRGGYLHGVLTKHVVVRRAAAPSPGQHLLDSGRRLGPGPGRDAHGLGLGDKQALGGEERRDRTETQYRRRRVWRGIWN